jgi:peptide/nickel transport system permease protein
VARSAAGAALGVLLAAALLQTLVAFTPGDAADVVAGGETVSGGDALADGLRHAWGLDASAAERVLRTLSDLMRGDLGTSWTVRPGAPVTELLGAAVPDTLVRVGAALLAACALAGPLALTRARSRAAWGVGVLGAPPVFLIALLAVAGLNAAAWQAMEQGWIERPAWFALPDTPSGLRTALAVLLLAIAGGAFNDLYGALRAEVERIRRAPFAEAAASRGEAPTPLLLRHLATPAAALLAARVPWLLGAAVVVERMLMLDGAGSLLWTACGRRDAPVAVGVAVTCAALVGVARVCADGVRAAVDPRVRT